MITIAAPAKINLYLHIIGKQEDGYHILDSLVGFAKVSDLVRVRPSKTLKNRTVGPYAKYLGNERENLVFQAARKLRKVVGISSGAEILLEKNLPVASGIGSGSSDAAATIKALVKLWNIDFEERKFLSLALELGSDVPICLFGRAGFVGGIGEKIFPIQSLPTVPMVLLNPGVKVPTRQIFKAWKGSFSKMARFDFVPETVDELVKLLMNGRKNDLGKTAVKLIPEIEEVLKVLRHDPDCKLARMTGSGATCFGLFETTYAADAAVKRFSFSHPWWWAVSTELVGDVQKIFSD